jgi:hypothetical protein
MRVVEEPFVTRDALLRVFRPLAVTSERPLQTLRRNKAASLGLAVQMRSGGGQLVGSVRLYSSLNSDAARALRWDEVGLAQSLAARAQQLERSPAAARVRDAVALAAAKLPLDPLNDTADPQLRRYIDLRRRTSWHALERQAFLGDWLAQSHAWLDSDFEPLAEAVMELSREAEQARADLISREKHGVSTFYGTVERLDPLYAEIEAENGEAMLVSRERLEREGLAVLGRAVAILEEVGPGGDWSAAMPAASLESPLAVRPSPFDEPAPDDAILGRTISGRDVPWVRAALKRPNPARSALPLRIV